MHSAQESQLNTLTRVGIIAGAGRLPLLLVEALERRGLTPHIIVLEGTADASLYAARSHTVLPIGRAGRILGWLKEKGATDLVLAGSLQRPQWATLKVDPRGLMFVAKVALKSLGDDGLLRAIRRELEAEGFTLHGIQEFLPELLAPAGVMGRVQPLAEDEESLTVGYNAAKEHGRQDKGQSVIVQQGTVLGLEGREGTAALMKSCAANKSVGRGPILVKVCKPQQDKALDMPTIGAQTVEMAKDLGFCGIAVEAGETLILDQSKVTSLCDEYGLFLMGMEND